MASAQAGPSATDDAGEPSTSTAAVAWTPSDNPSGIKPVLQNIVATCNLAVELDLKTIALHARNAEYNPKRFAAVIMRIREPKTTALIFRSGKMVVTGAKSEEAARTAARKYARIIQKLDFPARFADFKIQNMVGSCDVKFPIRLEGLAYKHSHYSSYEPELFPGLIYRMVQPKIVLLIFVSGATAASTAASLCMASSAPLRSAPCLAAALRRTGFDLPRPPAAPRRGAGPLRPAPAAARLRRDRAVALPRTGKVVLTGGKLRKEIYAAFEQIYPVLQEFRKSTDVAPPVSA